MKNKNEKIVPAFNHAYVEKPTVDVIGGFSVSAQRPDGFYECKIISIGSRDEKYQWIHCDQTVLITYNPFNDKVSRTIIELSNVIGRIV